jgi:hypothetical protein
MVKFIEVEKEIIGKHGVKIVTTRIMTEKTYENRKKGVSTAQAFSYNEAVSYINKFEFEGNNHHISFLYEVGWRSVTGFFSNINEIGDFYGDNNNMSGDSKGDYSQVYAIEITSRQ